MLQVESAHQKTYQHPAGSWWRRFCSTYKHTYLHIASTPALGAEFPTFVHHQQDGIGIHPYIYPSMSLCTVDPLQTADAFVRSSNHTTVTIHRKKKPNARVTRLDPSEVPMTLQSGSQRSTPTSASDELTGFSPSLG